MAPTGRYVVKFAPGVSRGQRAQTVQAAGATVRRNFTLFNAISIQVPNDAALNGLRNNPNVLSITPDRLVAESMPPATPTAPTGLTVVGTTSTTASLQWTDLANNEEGFTIERCAGGGCNNFTPVATAPLSAGVGGTVNFTNTGLSASTTYRYQVRAFITSGPKNDRDSGPSNTVSALTTPAAPPPAAPSGLSANAVSETQVDLTWADNATTETGFRIYRCVGAGCNPASLLTDINAANAQAYTDSTVNAGATYRYLARAYNAGGESGNSNIATATTPAAPSLPLAPSGLLITSVSSSQVSLEFTDNSDNENGFEIERCVGAGCNSFGFYDTLAANQTSYNDGVVASSTTYRYRARAFNGVGDSGYSNIAAATTSPPPPPPPPPPVTTSGTRQVIPYGVQRVGPPVYLDDGTPVSDGSGIGVAVLDTGIDFNNPDLNPAPDVAGTTSYNAFNMAGSCQDDRDHGTHVAGIIAAQNNNIGVLGVAPGATVYCVKVLDSTGQGDETDVAAGLEWVALNHTAVNPPIRVVNMSLGRPLQPGETINTPNVMRDAIVVLRNLGIVVVVSAGNDSTVETTQNVPSAYPEVLSIGGIVTEPGNDNGCGFPETLPDSAAFYTSDGQFNGSQGITVSAPSEERNDSVAIGTSCFAFNYGVNSTRLIHNPGSLGPNTVITSRQVEPLAGASGEAVGTSFAAPHVSGVVARIMQLGLVAHTSDLNEVENIRAYLRSTADRRDSEPVDPNEPADAPVNPGLASFFGNYSFDGEREGIAQAPRGN